MDELFKMKSEWMEDPAFRAGYEEQTKEFAILDTIASGMRAARKHAGLTQKDVAVRMKTTQSAIARLESGKQEPTPSTLSAYAQATGTELHIEFRPPEV
jgi:ribosome-binding protein aMBF1 (putative translation factor)